MLHRNGGGGASYHSLHAHASQGRAENCPNQVSRVYVRESFLSHCLSLIFGSFRTDIVYLDYADTAEVGLKLVNFILSN